LHCIALLCLALPAHAESLPDPTQPPHVAATPSALSGTAAPPTSGYTLTSIRASDATRRALLNGKWVRQGERVDGARVVAIRETEVVLATEAGRETLGLFPEVRVKPAPTPSGGTERSEVSGEALLK
jgi:MSHA biogenesis protein MshK